MKRISSNITLFLKLFIPIFYVVFYGSFTVAFWLVDATTLPFIGSWIFRIGFTLFYILGAVLLYFTLYQVKRVEIDAEYLYISNYFKTFRYPFRDVKKITQRNYLLFHTTQIHFVKESSYGTIVTFLARRGILDQMKRDHPAWFE